MNWQPIWKNVFGEAPGSDDIEAMNEFTQLCHPHLDDPLFIIVMFLQRQCGLLVTRSGEVVFSGYELEEVSKRLKLQIEALAGMGNGLVAASRSVRAQVERVAHILDPLTDDVLRNSRETASAPAVPQKNQPRAMANSGQWKAALPLLNGCAWVVALTVLVVLVTGRPQAVTPEAAAAVLAPDNPGSLLTAKSNGDLQMLLSCDHPTWTYRQGYCRPKAGIREIQGWNAFRSEDRDANQK